MPTDLKHKPFASLRGAPVIEPSPGPAPLPSARPTQATQAAQGANRLIAREEFDPQEQAVITRVIGLPQNRLDGLGKQLRSALGAVALIEGRDLLAITPDVERVASWLQGTLGAEVSVVRRPEEQKKSPGVDLSKAGEAGGTVRAQIRRGLRVAIVQKADQPTGALTEGVVRDILTSSAEHHRGIKVRLESGEVGRIQRVLGR